MVPAGVSGTDPNASPLQKCWKRHLCDTLRFNWNVQTSENSPNMADWTYADPIFGRIRSGRMPRSVLSARDVVATDDASTAQVLDGQSCRRRKDHSTEDAEHQEEGSHHARHLLMLSSHLTAIIYNFTYLFIYFYSSKWVGWNIYEGI